MAGVCVELARKVRADLLQRVLGGRELRMLGEERAELVLERVVLGVGDRGLAAVVELLVAAKVLRELGVSLDVREEDRAVEAPSDSPVTGKTVVITGTLSVARKDFQGLLEAAGAKASGSLSAKTDYLVAGESAGSKLAKAESLGVQVLSEVQAREMLARQS